MGRPVMGGEHLILYQEDKELVDAKKVAEGVERWKAANEKSEKAGNVKLAMW
jgi:hypothetical protein